MKKAISIITLGTLLATSSLYAGGNVVVAEEMMIAAIPEQVDPNPFYVGVGIIWAGVSRDCIEPNCPIIRLKDSTWGGIIRAGYDFNQYFGIEARALKATLDSDWAETTHYGIFLKPFLPVGEQINIYGLLGYGHTKVVTDCALQEEFTHNGFSYGIGLEYDLSDKEDDYEAHKKNKDDILEFDRPFDGHGDQEVGWGLWIDWQNLMHDEGADKYRANIISFGVTYDF